MWDDPISVYIRKQKLRVGLFMISVKKRSISAHFQASHLTGLCQAHADPEAGGHAGGQRGGQRTAQSWVDHLDTFDHRFHDQLTAEALDAVDVLTHLTEGHNIQQLQFKKKKRKKRLTRHATVHSAVSVIT